MIGRYCQLLRLAKSGKSRRKLASHSDDAKLSKVIIAQMILGRWATAAAAIVK